MCAVYHGERPSARLTSCSNALDWLTLLTIIRPHSQEECANAWRCCALSCSIPHFFCWMNHLVHWTHSPDYHSRCGYSISGRPFIQAFSLSRTMCARRSYSLTGSMCSVRVLLECCASSSLLCHATAAPTPWPWA